MPRFIVVQNKTPLHPVYDTLAEATAAARKSAIYGSAIVVKCVPVLRVEATTSLSETPMTEP